MAQVEEAWSREETLQWPAGRLGCAYTTMGVYRGEGEERGQERCQSVILLVRQRGGSIFDMLSPRPRELFLEFGQHHAHHPLLARLARRPKKQWQVERRRRWERLSRLR